jgi:hypothetical protein
MCILKVDKMFGMDLTLDFVIYLMASKKSDKIQLVQIGKLCPTLYPYKLESVEN